jgi:hypothetical protein
VGVLLLGALGAGSVASASSEEAEVRIGTLVVRADGGFRPSVLPRRHRVPIRFQGHAEIRTTDGSVPPALQRIKLEFDRDGKLNTAGLPACLPGQLEGTTVKLARRRCKGAIVGGGQVGAVISFLGARFRVRSPFTLFNGPRVGGDPTVIGHAQTSVPVFQSVVVVARIERRGGLYGYRTSFDIPPIAGGAGALTDIKGRLGRRYRFRGAERSYVTARCSDGILQTQGYLSFADGNVLSGSLFKPCQGT